MKFIIDAQLPIRLKDWLNKNGQDAIHTVDLPNKQFTSDLDIIEIAEKTERIVISKDSDFYKHNLIKGKPKKLLFITTGNIVNSALMELFQLNFQTILNYFKAGNKVIEVDNNSIIVHS